MKSFTVRGKVILPEGTPAKPFKVYIRLLDTSLADAAAKTIAETVIDYSPGEPKTKKDIPFEIKATTPAPNLTCSLFVHLDVDGDGTLSVGDWMHSQSYPVNLSNTGTQEIRLREVL